jgi:hypothetical protein
MSNLYSKIHRLKAQGWTWDFFLQQIELIYPPGIDEKTLYGLYRKPHRKANSHISNILLTLHNQYFPSPFPVDTQSILALYNSIISCKNHQNKNKDIKDFLIFLDHSTCYGGSLRKARLHWIIGDIHLDLLPELRNNGLMVKLAAHKAKALENYQTSRQLLQQVNQNNNPSQNNEIDQITIDSFTFYKLEQNMLACYLNSLAVADRYHDPLVKKYLTDSNFIQSSKTVLSIEPYQWIIARNGLRFSSLNTHLDDCIFFYQALVTANKEFLDFSYTPNGAPAISNSPEFNWAMDRIRNHKI